jgi:HrpA-like RNA helicase
MTEKNFLDLLLEDKKRKLEGKKSALSFTSAILLDEVHERSMNIDLVMALLKEVVLQ